MQLSVPRQSESIRHSTHSRAAVSQIGVSGVGAQSVLSSQPGTQEFAAPQTNPAAVQSASTSHSTHDGAPPAGSRQMISSPMQPLSIIAAAATLSSQATHVLVAPVVLQTGPAAPSSSQPTSVMPVVSSRQGWQLVPTVPLPEAPAQMGADAGQPWSRPEPVIVSTQTTQVLSSEQTESPPQSASTSHSTHVFVAPEVSQAGNVALQPASVMPGPALSTQGSHMLMPSQTPPVQLVPTGWAGFSHRFRVHRSRVH